MALCVGGSLLLTAWNRTPAVYAQTVEDVRDRLDSVETDPHDESPPVHGNAPEKIRSLRDLLAEEPFPAHTNATDELAPEADSTREESVPGRRPLVVLKQTEIAGKVFFLDESEVEDDRAKGVRIEVRTLDAGDLLFGTVTDEKGTYTLPNFDVGTYRLVVGGLILELLIEEPDQPGVRKRRIPKTILVFIPKELR